MSDSKFGEEYAYTFFKVEDGDQNSRPKDGGLISGHYIDFSLDVVNAAKKHGIGDFKISFSDNPEDFRKRKSVVISYNRNNDFIQHEVEANEEFRIKIKPTA